MKTRCKFYGSYAATSRTTADTAAFPCEPEFHGSMQFPRSILADTPDILARMLRGCWATSPFRREERWLMSCVCVRRVWACSARTTVKYTSSCVIDVVRLSVVRRPTCTEPVAQTRLQRQLSLTTTPADLQHVPPASRPLPRRSYQTHLSLIHISEPTRPY